jgi:transposase
MADTLDEAKAAFAKRYEEVRRGEVIGWNPRWENPLKGLFPFLEKLFADSAYQGPLFANGLAKILPCLKAEIIKRSDQAKGFVKLPKRWIVERTIAWLNRCRRLAKDWENLNRNALAFLKLASICLMLRKLCNP